MLFIKQLTQNLAPFPRDSTLLLRWIRLKSKSGDCSLPFWVLLEGATWFDKGEFFFQTRAWIMKVLICSSGWETGMIWILTYLVWHNVSHVCQCKLSAIEFPPLSRISLKHTEMFESLHFCERRIEAAKCEKQWIWAFFGKTFLPNKKSQFS